MKTDTAAYSLPAARMMTGSVGSKPVAPPIDTATCRDSPQHIPQRKTRRPPDCLSSHEAPFRRFFRRTVHPGSHAATMLPAAGQAKTTKASLLRAPRNSEWRADRNRPARPTEKAATGQRRPSCAAEYAACGPQAVSRPECRPEAGRKRAVFPYSWPDCSVSFEICFSASALRLAACFSASFTNRSPAFSAPSLPSGFFAASISF